MNTEAVKHRLVLLDRKALELSGVRDVVSFDETNVVLETVCGMLAIEGGRVGGKRKRRYLLSGRRRR